MTIQPTDEEIRVTLNKVRNYWSATIRDDCTWLLEMWLAERQAARDGVTDEMVDSAVNVWVHLQNDDDPGYKEWDWLAWDNAPELRRLMRAALQSIAQPVRVPDREYLGRQVREVWITWAREQPNPKPSWLMRLEELSEPDREVDCRIGEHIAKLSTSPQPQQAVPDGWLTIETAPVDGTPHLRGLWVSTSHGEFWDVDSGYVDEEGGFVDLSGDYIGWDVTDYSHWLPLPTPPTVQRQEGMNDDH